jgi:effector-binding domain-containing protein
VQVTRPFDPVNDVRASSLPGGLVATATHTGPVSELSKTHETIKTWCEQRDHRLAGPR